MDFTTFQVRRTANFPERFALFTPRGVRLAMPDMSRDGLLAIGLTPPPPLPPEPPEYIIVAAHSPGRNILADPRIVLIQARELQVGDYVPSPVTADFFLRVTAVGDDLATGLVIYDVANCDDSNESLGWDPIPVLIEELRP
jgi:hypothetical protein